MAETSCSALLLFGATGDLSRRMLLPSLYALHEDGLIDPTLRIVGTARSEFTMTPNSAKWPAPRCSSSCPQTAGDDAQLASFLERLEYQTLDASKPDGFIGLAEKLGDTTCGLSIFLSTAPALFEPTIEGLRFAGLAHEGVRIGLEKPLGNDLASSRRINDAVAAGFSEKQIFRIDHYLGKETVQNLIALRFANMMFEPLWNSAGIDHVQITVSETVGLEGRKGFYDETGAMRDMVQNHMLQLVALTAMEPPLEYDATSIRDEKVKVLRALRPVKAEEMVRGQYRAGAVGGTSVTGYLEDLGAASDTETYVAIKAHVDNWRWQGVPFYLRHGKRLSRTAQRDRRAVQGSAAQHLHRTRRQAQRQPSGDPPAAGGIRAAAGHGQGAGARSRRDRAARGQSRSLAHHRFRQGPPPHCL